MSPAPLPAEVAADLCAEVAADLCADLDVEGRGRLACLLMADGDLERAAAFWRFVAGRDVAEVGREFAPWSVAEHARLAEEIAAGRSWPEIAERHGRSVEAVRSMASKTGASAASTRHGTGNRWSADQVTELNALFALGLKDAEIAKRTGRTVKAVSVKRCKLGLNKRGGATAAPETKPAPNEAAAAQEPPAAGVEAEAPVARAPAPSASDLPERATKILAALRGLAARGAPLPDTRAELAQLCGLRISALDNGVRDLRRAEDIVHWDYVTVPASVTLADGTALEGRPDDEERRAERAARVELPRVPEDAERWAEPREKRCADCHQFFETDVVRQVACAACGGRLDGAIDDQPLGGTSLAGAEVS